MAARTSVSLPVPVARGGRLARIIAEFSAFWRDFYARAINPYRPELHYMRGPGPAWRAKHKTRKN